MRKHSEVAVGDELGETRFEATNLKVFLIGVPYWSSHRIHYDRLQAVAEGFDDVVVTGTLLYAWVEEFIADWAGDHRCIRRLSFKNVGLVYVGQTVTVTGRIVDVECHAHARAARCEVAMRRDGDVVLSAVGVVDLD